MKIDLILKKMKKEYETQDNRGTAFPIFVTVQELRMIGVVNPDYGMSDGSCEMKTKYTVEDYEGTFDTREDAVEEIQRDYGTRDDYREIQKIDSIKELHCGYCWIDVEFFLTIKAAEKFMKQNAHNMEKTRTHVKYFHRRNFEMRELLSEVGFRTGD